MEELQEEIHKTIKSLINELHSLTSRKRTLIDEVINLEFELDECRTEIRNISYEYWGKRIQLDSLERKLSELLERKK